MTSQNPAENNMLVRRGISMSDGSYAIRDQGELRDAIAKVGQSANPYETKVHVIKRARALMLKSEIPISWL